MKKIDTKYIVSIIVILFTIVSIFFIISRVNVNKKIIYYSYTKMNGFILIEDTMTIYDNGTVEKIYEANNEEKIYKSKLSREEFAKIREIINNIENSELHLVEKTTFDEIIYDDVKEYINLNKKIFLNNQNIRYTNEYIKELDKKILEIKESHFK